MSKGIITTYVLVFGAVFLILLSGLLGFILLQSRQSAQSLALQKALHVAEAGIDYYKWCLNNGIQDSCQTEKDYLDPAGVPVGRFSLQVESTLACGQAIQRKIISTGWVNNFPSVKRKISVTYARESVATFSYILNNNVWIGSDHEIRGPYHSNGGVRMDGENKSLVSSGQVEWTCTDSFNCSPCPVSAGCRLQGTSCICPGVFTTANGNEDLFDFPVTPFDFAGITVDLAGIKNLTKNQGQGLYFGPSGQYGYHILFNDDGSMDVWMVDSVNMIDDVCTVVDFKVICDNNACVPECPKCQNGRCVVQDPVIDHETYLGQYVVPGECGAIFFEDNLWVGDMNEESKIKGKVTVVSADLINPSGKTDVWLQGSINYTTLDGSDGLSIIAQHNNLIGLYSPDQMELRGIFIAQNGYFGRNYYPCPTYAPYCLRSKLEIIGSVVSDGRVGTQWGSGASGYLVRESYFDPKLIHNPPVFVPNIEPDFKIVNWQEVK